MSRMLWIALALSLSTPAHAWRHLQVAWDDNRDFPVPYATTDDGLASCGRDLEGGACIEAAQAAFQGWSDAACTRFGGEDEGFLGEDQAPDLLGDGVNHIRFDAELGPGVLGRTEFDIDGVAFSRNGLDYYRVVEADIEIASQGPWATHAEVVAGSCLGQVDLQAVIAHEIGHLAGLGHSCENGEPCEDPALRGATMYWAADTCDATRALPQSDDVAGIEALYGPGATFSCGTTGLASVLGIAPLTLNCALSSESAVASAAWTFGDGSSDSGTAVTHTWETEGLYQVAVEVSGTDPACGAWESTVVRPGYIRACEEPRAAFHLDHVFGSTYEVRNDTRLNVVGCVTDVRWAIYRGGEIRGEPHEVLENWEYTYEFPDEGEWTVVLNVSGPGGTTAARVTLDARKYAGLNPLGCASGGSVDGGGVGALVLLLLLGLRRRR